MKLGGRTEGERGKGKAHLAQPHPSWRPSLPSLPFPFGLSQSWGRTMLLGPMRTQGSSPSRPLLSLGLPLSVRGLRGSIPICHPDSEAETFCLCPCPQSVLALTESTEGQGAPGPQGGKAEEVSWSECSLRPCLTSAPCDFLWCELIPRPPCSSLGWSHVHEHLAIYVPI